MTDRPRTLLVALLSVLLVAASAARNSSAAPRGAPLQLVAARGALWLVTCDRGCSGRGRESAGRIVKIDPRTGHVVRSVELTHPGALAVGAGGVYATDFWQGTVRRLNPNTLQRTGSLHLTLPFAITTATGRDTAFLPEAVAASGNRVWVASDRGALARADPSLDRVTAMLRLPGDAFQTIAANGNIIWLSESLLGIYRIDPARSTVVARIPIGPADGRLDASQLLPAGERLFAIGAWAHNGLLATHNGLARIDAAHNRVEALTALPTGRLVAALGAGSLWVGRVDGRMLERIDPRTGRVEQRVDAHVGVALAFASGSLWTVEQDGTLAKLVR